MKSHLLRNIAIGGLVTAFGIFSLNGMTALAHENENGSQNRSNMPRNGQMMNPNHRGNRGQGNMMNPNHRGNMMQNLTPEEREAMQEECYENMRQNGQMYRNQPNNENQEQSQ